MDNFLDVIIVRKKRGLYNLLYFLASMVMFILALVAVMFVLQVITENGFNIEPAIIFVITGGIAFLLFWSRSSIKIDYDISFTNGFVEIARVANNIKRKEICRFYMKEVEEGGYTTSSNFARYNSMKNIKKYRAVLNRDAKLYYLFVRVNEKSALVMFEDNTELIELMKKYAPRTARM